MIAFVYGTRPEAIKLEPVITLCRERGLPVFVVCTGQHRELLDTGFDLRPDVKLDVMAGGQDLTGKLARALATLPLLARANWLVVQGDTTSALAGALAGFYAGVRVCHVEAGLRTSDFKVPFPEEAHRRMITQLATLHCAPTEHAAANLGREGVRNVHVTGNTIVDAWRQHLTTPQVEIGRQEPYPFALLTLHRRENHALIDGLVAATEAACSAHGLELVCVTHPGAPDFVAGSLRTRLYPAQSWMEMQKAIIRSTLVITDSGGLQEEAAIAHRPCVVLRAESDRPESLNAGLAVLASTVLAVEHAVSAALSCIRPRWDPCPYGDGFAAERIVELLK